MTEFQINFVLWIYLEIIQKKALCYKKHLDYIFVTEIDWNYGF